MSWNPLKLLGIVDKGMDLADQFITDKDLREEFKHNLAVLKEQVYLAELGTKTIPWVDAVHKLGRQIISLVTVLAGFTVLYMNPDIDVTDLAAVSAPGAIYNFVKGKGQ